MRLIDLTGQRFGRLRATSMSTTESGLTRWNCVCDCGGLAIVKTKYLRNGKTRSCGCLHIEESIRKVMSRRRPIGFERTTSKGYIEIKTADGFRRKHIYIMEEHIGRRLLPGEAVHHKDENKLNNEIENLELMSHADHTIYHNRKRK